RHRLNPRDAVFLQQRFDVALPGRLEVGQQDRLLARQPGGRAVFLEEGTQAARQPQGPVVLDPAVLDGDAEEELAVPLLVPAEMVVDIADRDRLWIGQAAPNVLL